MHADGPREILVYSRDLHHGLHKGGLPCQEARDHRYRERDATATPTTPVSTTPRDEEETSAERTPRRSPRHTAPLGRKPIPIVFNDSDDDEDQLREPEDTTVPAENIRPDNERNSQPRDVPSNLELAEIIEDDRVGGHTEEYITRGSVDREEESRADQPQMLDAVTTTNTVLKSMFNKLESSFKASMNTLTRSVAERMDQLDKKFEVVSTELVDIRAIVSKTNTSSKNADTPLNRFMKLLDRLTPSDGLVVNREACHRILSTIVPYEVLKTVRDNGLSKEPVNFRFATAIQMLLCGKQPKETRKQFRQGIGGRHSRFKKTLFETSYITFRPTTLVSFPITEGRPLSRENNRGSRVE